MTSGVPACTFQFLRDPERPKDRVYKRRPCKHASGAASLEPMQEPLIEVQWLRGRGEAFSCLALSGFLRLRKHSIVTAQGKSASHFSVAMVIWQSLGIARSLTL